MKAIQLSVLGVVSSLGRVCFWRFHCIFLLQSVFYLSTTLVHKYTSLSLTSYSPVVRSAEESEGDGKNSSLTREY